MQRIRVLVVAVVLIDCTLTMQSEAVTVSPATWVARNVGWSLQAQRQGNQITLAFRRQSADRYPWHKGVRTHTDNAILLRAMERLEDPQVQELGNGDTMCMKYDDIFLEETLTYHKIYYFHHLKGVIQGRVEHSRCCANSVTTQF